MKQIRIMTAVFTVLMAAALIGGLVFLNGTGYRGRDVSLYNDRVHRMAADYAEVREKLGGTGASEAVAEAMIAELRK